MDLSNLNLSSFTIFQTTRLPAYEMNWQYFVLLIKLQLSVFQSNKYCMPWCELSIFWRRLSLFCGVNNLSWDAFFLWNGLLCFDDRSEWDVPLCRKIKNSWLRTWYLYPSHFKYRPVIYFTIIGIIYKWKNWNNFLKTKILR